MAESDDYYSSGRNNPGGFGPAPTGNLLRDLENSSSFSRGQMEARRLADSGAESYKRRQGGPDRSSGGIAQVIEFLFICLALYGVVLGVVSNNQGKTNPIQAARDGYNIPYQLSISLSKDYGFWIAIPFGVPVAVAVGAFSGNLGASVYHKFQ